MTPSTEQELWGIVLAGGDGTRVHDFLMQVCGSRGIKQFCAVTGRRSMLEHTLARVERLIPRERILIVVSTHHRPEVEAQLAHWPADNVIFQTLNRDTAPGIFLPLAHVSHRAPGATAAIFPSDHFIMDEARFMAHVHTAVEETARFPHELTLLGMMPDEIEDGYGWIEPLEKEAGRESYRVHRFWEKPPPLQAYGLLRRGALWNTFVCVAQARTLWEMAREAAPDLYALFMLIRKLVAEPQGLEAIGHIYQTLRPVNFSADICTSLVSRLRVLPVPEVGWSDWGSAERILASLQRIGKLEACVAQWQRRGAEVPPEFLMPAYARTPPTIQPFL